MYRTAETSLLLRTKVLLWRISSDRFLFIYLKIREWLLNSDLRIVKITKKSGDFPIYRIDDSQANKSLYISRLKRFFKYKNGLDFRFKSILEKYFIDKKIAKDIDFFCDVGANIGEVTKIVQELNRAIKLVAIEPDSIELEALNSNLSAVDIYQCFLDSDISLKRFVFQNQTGDTRLLQSRELPRKSILSTLKRDSKKQQELVLTSTLDSILHNYEFTSGFLKLEAEGFEPEVLQGGSNVMSRFKYIGIDVSEERFQDSKYISSFEACNSILTRFNFKVLYRSQNSCLFFRDS